MTDTQVLVDGVVVRYVLKKNKGPVFCFLHGWGTSLETFDPLTGALGDISYVSLDFPGFGRSAMPPHSWGVPDYANFLLHFLKKIEVAPDILVGHSFGGRVALFLCRKGLLHPGKLILIDAAGIALPTSLKASVFKIGAKVLRPFVSEGMRKKIYSMLGSTDYKQAGTMRETFLKVVRQDLRNEAEQIKIPTLLV